MVIRAGYRGPRTKTGTSSALETARDSSRKKQPSRRTRPREGWTNSVSIRAGANTEFNNGPKSKAIAEPQELFTFLAMPGIEVTKLLFSGDENCMSPGSTRKRRKTCLP